MSGSQIGGIIGAIIGGVVTQSPQGAMYGYAIGSGVGAIVLPDKLPTSYGPRLEDLRAQSSVYGNPIPIVYGTAALQGTVIWAMDIKEVATETEQGGKGGPSQTSVNYTYFGSFAVAICEGPVNGVARIWAGPEKRLVYDGVVLEGGAVRIYLGDEDQLPDPLIEADKGVGFAPAYRGTAYVVFEDFPLAKDGNRFPFLTFEVGAVVSTCPIPVLQPGGRYMSDPAPEFVTNGAEIHRMFYDAKTAKLYWTNKNSLAGYWELVRYDPVTKVVDPDTLILAADSDDIEIAWDNNGGAQFIVKFTPFYNIISLENWVIVTGIDTSFFDKYRELDGFETAVPVPLFSIAYNGNNYTYLSWQNQANTCPVRGGPPCGVYPVRGSLTGGSTGVRSGGYLTPLGGYGVASSFPAQPSSFSPEPTQWDVFASGKTNVLVSFQDSAYATPTSGYHEVGSTGLGSMWHSVYDPFHDRIFAWEIGMGLVGFKPSKIATGDWQRDECIYYDNRFPQNYADGTPITFGGLGTHLAVLPRGRIAVSSYPNGDVFIVEPQIRYTAHGIPLSEVIADLSERAGESRYDVSQLTDDIVDGYVISRQTEVRAAIDAIRPAYYFDAVESQGIIKFVKRGGTDVTVIPDNDLGAYEPGNDPPDPLQTVRRMEMELPRAVSVKYLSAATDYDEGTRQARRLIGGSQDEKTIEVPLVMTDTKAQEVAEVNLHASWGERLSYQFSLPRKYSYLEPTDLVVIKGHLMRLTAVNATPQGVLRCEALADETAYYAPHVVVTEPEASDKTVSQPGVTLLELF
jgi:hypothetical protein